MKHIPTQNIANTEPSQLSDRDLDLALAVEVFGEIVVTLAPTINSDDDPLEKVVDAEVYHEAQANDTEPLYTKSGWKYVCLPYGVDELDELELYPEDEGCIKGVNPVLLSEIRPYAQDERLADLLRRLDDYESLVLDTDDILIIRVNEISHDLESGWGKIKDNNVQWLIGGVHDMLFCRALCEALLELARSEHRPRTFAYGLYPHEFAAYVEQRVKT